MRLRASTLAAWLGLDAAWVALVSLGLLCGDTPRRALNEDPGARAVGLVYVILGWTTLVRARVLSVGLRRALASLGALGLCAAGSLRLAGPPVSDAVALWLGEAWQGPAATCGGALGLFGLTAYAWATSPLRR
ncbi:MAG: hypothetical protein HY909_05790 [Deltaproteobacteria bacterium]|nr:hypothetical protein [Deltaproteobacteria bacterium]